MQFDAFERGKSIMDTTIIITTYRRTAMLAELIEVLKPQLANPRVETIVIDNCPDASARPTVESAACELIRYVHEPRSGIVNARNRGVAEARGTYLIFVDDDEVPAVGWLDAWLMQADGSTDLAFGRIVPRLLGPCPPALAGQINRAYSRELAGPTGTDITAKSAYVGTGNAMFHKARCFASDAPFDLRFNARGGEDVCLIRSLVRQGRKLRWNREALVEELVPENRMTLPYAMARKFNQGQLRCIVMYGDGGPAGIARVAIWMTVGAIQFVVFGLAAQLMSVFAPVKAPDFACRARGGAGKLLWWRAPGMHEYGQK
jgi:glycosyltransferase involved in cell wall biosynthesis